MDKSHRDMALHCGEDAVVLECRERHIAVAARIFGGKVFADDVEMAGVMGVRAKEVDITFFEEHLCDSFYTAAIVSGQRQHIDLEWYL